MVKTQFDLDLLNLIVRSHDQGAEGQGFACFGFVDDSHAHVLR